MAAQPNLSSMFNDKWQDHMKATDAKDMKFSDSPRYVTFTHPGMPFWSFELDPRLPGLTNMLKVCEDCLYFGCYQRMREHNNQTLVLVIELIAQGFIPFHGAHEYIMTKEMYDPDIPKYPLKAKVNFTGLNGPLLNVQVQLFTAESNTLLMTRSQNLSFVNMKTRKLDDLPEWYTKALDGKETEKISVQIDRLIKPEKTYTQKATILFTDIDTFQHANYLTYVLFCQRAIRQAATENLRAAKTPKRLGAKPGADQNLLKKITSDVMKKGVKTARLRYFKECVVGDEVVVHMWEEQDKPFWAFFSVESETPGGASVLRFQMSLEYFK